MLLYQSTNRSLAGGCRRRVSFREALFDGLAPDAGLYMPVDLPALDLSRLRALQGAPYRDLATEVLRAFLEPEIDCALIERTCHDAYDFDVPLEPVSDNVSLLRLDRGPTASFKDFAARFMARIMGSVLGDRASSAEGEGEGESDLRILVATSGDTGAAVGEAFRALPGTRVDILYPENEVSDVQRRTLDGIGENVQALRVAGKFDDCQRFVKRAFSDPDLASLRLTSANSINIGRVLPQVVFYAYAWVASGADAPITVSVPSGNLGNSLGCEIARRMGVPIERLIVAHNENDAFPHFLDTGTYSKVEPSRACLSNAMNVGNPSNLARYFDLYGGTITKDGEVLTMPDLDAMRQNLHVVSVSDQRTVETIRAAYERFGVVVEPHGAVGLRALWDACGETPPGPAVCIETAHPAKFPEVIERELGLHPAPTEALARIAAREGTAHPLPNDYEAFKRFLEAS